VRDHVVIIGLMASGKTTVGAALAEALGRAHRDSDADIERMTGRTARRIADDEGIDRLHAMELDLLLDALADPEPNVVSAAASVIDEPRGVAALRDPGIEVVWLRASPRVLRTRIDADDHRPSPESLEAQARRRAPVFAELADQTIEIEDRSPDDIVARIRADAADRPISPR
jgi:shikimate kinase